MSTGSIVDFQIKIAPSAKLNEFLIGLTDVESVPENVLDILKANKVNVTDFKMFKDEIKQESLTKEEKSILNDLKLEQTDFESALKLLDVEEEDIETLGNDLNEDDKTQYLNLNDLKWINKTLVALRSTNQTTLYLNDLLLGSKIILPKNEHIPRNPVLEARCKRLREEQENRVYRNMTKDVDAVRRTLPEDTIAYQMKSMNSQVIAVLQFVFSVVAGFAFGFIGIELIIGNLDFGFRLLLGIICALTIALAEIYFLAKKLNEIDEIPTEADLAPKTKPHAD